MSKAAKEHPFANRFSAIQNKRCVPRKNAKLTESVKTSDYEPKKALPPPKPRQEKEKERKASEEAEKKSEAAKKEPSKTASAPKKGKVRKSSQYGGQLLVTVREKKRERGK